MEESPEYAERSTLNLLFIKFRLYVILFIKFTKGYQISVFYDSQLQLNHMKAAFIGLATELLRFLFFIYFLISLSFFASRYLKFIAYTLYILYV